MDPIEVLKRNLYHEHKSKQTTISNLAIKYNISTKSVQHLIKLYKQEQIEKLRELNTPKKKPVKKREKVEVWPVRKNG